MNAQPGVSVERVTRLVAGRFVRRDINPAEFHSLSVYLTNQYTLRHGLSYGTSRIARRDNARARLIRRGWTPERLRRAADELERRIEELS